MDRGTDLVRLASCVEVEAESLENSKGRNAPETKAMYLKLLEIETMAAEEHTSESLRNLARRGAIIAALKAGEHERAKHILLKYEDSPEFGKELNKEMRLVVAEPERIWELQE